MSRPDFQRLLQFSDVDVNIQALSHVGGGRSSVAYATDEHVVKVLERSHSTQSSADKYADGLYGEQERIADYMGLSSIAMANVVVSGSLEGDHRIALVQRKITGVTMAEALASGQDPAVFMEYMSRGLKMYKDRRQMPDLACVEGRFFNPLIDPNTQVEVVDGVVRPILVDTTFGRLQRRSMVGGLLHTGIAMGVIRALKRLG